MDITSFSFIIFCITLIFVYYAVPKAAQWVVLLAGGGLFYVLGGNGIYVIYPLISAAVTHILVCGVHKTENAVLKKMLFIFNLIILLGLMIIFKVLILFDANIIIPLGLSFYTFILMGYAIDVYIGICEPQKNIFKTGLYGLFFPVLTAGPIIKIREDGSQLFTPHKICYKNLTFGAQRMLWGFFKKLVLSERFSIISSSIFADSDAYKGIYVWLGAVCFSFRLYTDFSGCMDIVIGLMEMLGIRLPENFDVPFMSKSISEFWRRWHITLGDWLRERLFYPLLRSGTINKISRGAKAKFGKKASKKITTYTAMFFLWMAVGLWHGFELKYIVANGLLPFFYIVTGELICPVFEKVFSKIGINTKSKFADSVRIIRTFILTVITHIYFNSASVNAANKMIRAGITVWNPEVLFNGSVLNLGLDIVEWAVLLISLLLLIIVDIKKYMIKEKEKLDPSYQGCRGIREYIAEMPAIAGWGIWFAFLFYCIIFAKYGPDYVASDFIYRGF